MKWLDENHRSASMKFICSSCGEICYYARGYKCKYKTHIKRKCGYLYCPWCGEKCEESKESEAHDGT